MKVLCCLDGTNSEEISNAVKNMLPASSLTIGLIYVTDSGPHAEIERSRERFMRAPQLDPRRRNQMRDAEASAAQDILEEGKRYLSGAEIFQRTGRPEREIVNFAVEWNAGLIVICPRSPRGGGPNIGPKSVGHVARFVLDHAPCPVLLVRPLQRITVSPVPPAPPIPPVPPG
ncbi:MAG TPA: universal stress protein [Ktedonobacteraceae bacterium]|nr:universal stress protein [Ktedonobacteraceae bacterium]